MRRDLALTCLTRQEVASSPDKLPACISIKVAQDLQNVFARIFLCGHSLSPSLQIGKIRSFTNKSRGLRQLKINVDWFYRPEECKAGRRVSLFACKEIWTCYACEVAEETLWLVMPRSLSECQEMLMDCFLQQFHGVKELFQSNHADTISAETVLQKCEVHTLSKYRVSTFSIHAQLSCCKHMHVTKFC